MSDRKKLLAVIWSVLGIAVVAMIVLAVIVFTKDSVRSKKTNESGESDQLEDAPTEAVATPTTDNYVTVYRATERYYQSQYEVRHILETYEYDNNARKIKANQKFSSTNDYQEYVYDEEGNLIEEITCSDNHIVYRELYQFDPKGREIMKSIISTPVSQAPSGWSYETVYDDEKRTSTQYFQYDSEEEDPIRELQCIRTYDENGNILIEDYASFVYQYEYDEHGNLVREYVNYEPGDPMGFHMFREYFYEETAPGHWRQTGIVFYDSGLRASHVDYEYDALGNLICMTTYSGDGEKATEKDIYVFKSFRIRESCMTEEDREKMAAAEAAKD